MRRIQIHAFLTLMICLAVAQAVPQQKLTSPVEQFGHEIGADYILLNYTQLVNYWQKLEAQSDRMKLVDIGKTAEGRTMWMAILTSPENHKRLDRYREISRRLAAAEGVSDEEAKKLASEGRVVVWTDGGLHGTEIVNAQQEMELVWQMVSQNDPETLRILNDVIILTTVTNPDGQEFVANWYMKDADPKKRTTGALPRLYHKYVGHDNNRDFYMVNMPETEAVCRVLYHEWFPQIMYNKHQTGPVGTVIFAPPFLPLFNYYLDPLISTSIDLVGAAIHSRFVVENKPGAVMGEMFSTWWNGGARTTPYFHNQIGLLTEVNGHPTPMEIPFVPDRILPNSNNPSPIAPQKVFRFRQAIDYIITVDRALFDVASKYREEFLYNMYLMGRRSIERGSRDHWTFVPKQVAEIKSIIAKAQAGGGADDASPRGDYFRRGVSSEYYEMMRNPAKRDPRGYILPSDQPDFITATRFVNALIKNGITVYKATRPFQVEGRDYSQGSYIVKTAQAFRPHVLDMFEPQDHPDDIPCPGGIPTPPYDSAGYTLAFQMGVRFDRVLDAFDGPFEKIQGLAAPPAGSVGRTGAPGYLLSPEVNESFVAINRLLASGEEVYRLKEPVRVQGKAFPAGAIYVPAKPATFDKLEKLAGEHSLAFHATEARPSGVALKLKPVRIGLWDQYGGSMPSGWTRWLFEQFEFPFEVVYAPALDAGDLAKKYDVLVFADGAIPRDSQPTPEPQIDPASIPAEFQQMLGSVTAARTIPQLKQFLADGGAILAIGSSTNIAYHLGLPVSNALVEKETGRPLPREKYYMPGSVHRISVDNAHPLAFGLPDEVDIYFSNSPLFTVNTGSGVRRIGWYALDDPLRSGWAWGRQYLKDAVAVAEAEVGRGKVILYGPQISFRAQPHGTFKLLFNGIYYGSAQTVKF